MKVFTLGYQGLDLEAYSQVLLDADVRVLIDVRERAWSYNRRYTKNVLEKTMSATGIRYVHLGQCGNPAINRHTAKSVKDCLTKFRDHLTKRPECITLLLGLIRTEHNAGRSVCLTCYERDSADCHRSILVDFLIQVDPLISAVHLQG